MITTSGSITGFDKKKVQSIPNSATTDFTMDWKIFSVFCIFYFAALTNVRDFPIPNIPLLYLAYLPLIPLFGVRRLKKGIQSTWQLSVINGAYWLYLILLRIMLQRFVFNIVYIAQILEPFLIFSATGMAAQTKKGTRSAFWALLAVLVLSTTAGNWIYFIGEPVQSFRITMQSSVGGNLVAGEHMRQSDKDLFKDEGIKRNSGLSVFAFHFSYELALAAIILTLIIMSRKIIFDVFSVVLVGMLLMVIIGIVTNAERASLLSITVGIVVFFLSTRTKIPIARIVIMGCVGLGMIVLIQMHSEDWEGQSLFKRKLNSGNESIGVRMSVIPLAAVSTVFESPFGAGDIYKAKTFNIIAKNLNWISASGEVQGVHHHFASIILNTGVFGIFLVWWFGLVLWKNLKWSVKSASSEGGPEVMLSAACIGLAIHSFTHNAGFFESDPGLQITLALLVASNTNFRRRIKKKNAQNRIVGVNVGQKR